MAWALVEGLAGVVDGGRTFDAVRLSPRWEAAGVTEAEVSVGYAASGAGVAYEYRRRDTKIVIDMRTEAAQVEWHVLLPAGCRATAVRRDGQGMPVVNVMVEHSPYADASCRVEGSTHLEIEIGAS
jgi:hypothetical protein